MEEVQTPRDGWWPENADAPMTQMLFRDGRGMANIVKSSNGWRAYSLLETNASGTTGKPLADGSVPSRLAAQGQAEQYADLMS